MSLPEICTTEQPYQPQRFVPRPQTEDAFWAWLQEAREAGAYAPILLLQGPPGSGKSWLLQKWHADINAGYPQEGLRAVYLPWARRLTEEASDASPTSTLSRGLWRAFIEKAPPPRPSAVAGHAAEIIAFLFQHFFATYPRARGLVLLVDGLDRLEPAQIRTVERVWLRPLLESGPRGRPIWMVLVHYGRIDEPRLRSQGQQTIFLEPWPPSEDRPRPLRKIYGQTFHQLAGTAPAFDFRYPLLNAYWDAQRAALVPGPSARHAWRLALACLFTRRAATRPWAAALQAQDAGKDWFDSPAGQAFTRVFRAHAAHQDAFWHKIRVQDVPERDRRLLRPLHDGSFWQVEWHFYRLDASLARFFHDAVHMLSQGSR